MNARVRSGAVLLAAVAVLAGACNPEHPPGQGIRCSVGVVGDSLMVGVQPSLPGQLRGTGCTQAFSDARTNRATAEGAAVLAARNLAGVDLLVVGLGTNDWYRPAEFEKLIDQVMKAARGRRVVWINTAGRLGNKDRLNEALFAATFRHDNLWILDWNHQITSNPKLLAGDGLHLTSAGYAHRSAVIARFIRTGS